MDVRCERCGTEYEFDDALVSDRGTSVKCTECQHEFRVMPSQLAVPAAGAGASGDEWAVTRAGGGLVVFTSLRDLQDAIRSGDLGREDMVSRPGRSGEAGRARALGSISELEHLFPAAVDPDLAPMRSRVDTLRPDPVASVPPPPDVDETDGSAVVMSAATEAAYAAIGHSPKPGSASTMQIGALTDARPVFKGTPIAAPPPSTRAPITPEPPPVLHDLASDSSVSDLDDDSSPLPPLSVRDRSSAPLSARAPVSTRLQTGPRSLRAQDVLAGSGVDSGQDSVPGGPAFQLLEDAATARIGSGRRVGGWVVALALVGGAAVVGFAVARPYLLGTHTAAATASGGPLDPQATQLVTAGEKALAAGDLDTAAGALEKASAIAPADARVALDRAKVAAAQADIAWLRPRLFTVSTSPADRTAAEHQVSELSQSADALASRAAALAPGEAASTRARVDALRLAGKLPEARAAAGPLSASSSDPETAYVLAALDAADPQPLWGTVVDRLRVAASTEGELGRARALLVYALARAGDTAGAARELDKLSAFTRPHPLVAYLRAFVEAAKSQVPAASGSGVALILPKEMDVNALPRTSSAPPPPGSATPGAVVATGKGAAPVAVAAGKTAGSGAAAGDTRTLDAQGEAARKAGEYERAAKLYSQALDRNANDSEALGGLGAVSQSKGDWEGAKASYRRALIVNPHFLPALIGLADVEWESGDRSAVEQTYHDITQRFPDGAYPRRVKERGDGASGGESASDDSSGTKAGKADPAAEGAAKTPASATGGAGSSAAPAAPGEASQ
jgi:predicted Zn finger-like uncharacterized protein